MAENSRWASARQLIVFFALVYALTWSAFLLAALATAPLRWPLLIAGAFAPSAVGVVLTAVEGGAPAVRRLLARLGQWRVDPRWYLVALGFMAAVRLTAAVLYRVGSGTWPTFGDYPAWYLVVLVGMVAMVFGGPLGEEIGWRGYALPRLRARYGDRLAGLALGVLWAVWHWPLFFIPGLDQFGHPFLPYVMYVAALSVVFTWVYRHTGGSLLIALLMHAAVNQTKDIVPSDNRLITWLVVGVLWLAAAVLIVFDIPGRPSRNPSVAEG